MTPTSPISERAVPEREYSIILANKLLDEPNCDPDDDLRILSRQLIRANEKILSTRQSTLHEVREMVLKKAPYYHHEENPSEQMEVAEVIDILNSLSLPRDETK